MNQIPNAVYTRTLACAAGTAAKQQHQRERTQMAIADLKNVLKIFGGAEFSADQENELFKEVLLMTLARAADADINIQNVEVDRIREILSSADVRVAARSELYAEASLVKYLGSVYKKLSDGISAACTRSCRMHTARIQSRRWLTCSAVTAT
jgi:hypothetical protein